MIETKSQAVSEEVSWNFRRADNHNHYVDDETTSQAVSKEALEAQESSFKRSILHIRQAKCLPILGKD